MTPPDNVFHFILNRLLVIFVTITFATFLAVVARFSSQIVFLNNKFGVKKSIILAWNSWVRFRIVRFGLNKLSFVVKFFAHKLIISLIKVFILIGEKLDFNNVLNSYHSRSFAVWEKGGIVAWHQVKVCGERIKTFQPTFLCFWWATKNLYPGVFLLKHNTNMTVNDQDTLTLVSVSSSNCPVFGSTDVKIWI